MKQVFKRTFALLLGTATILSMSVTGVAAETAGPKAENSYEKSPKEVLFLKGLQETYKIDGKTFTLYDINSDEKDELFIETESKKGSTLQIYFYDKKSKSAKQIKSYKQVTGIYKKKSEKRVVIVQKTGKNNTYSELKVKGKKLAAPVVVRPVKKTGKTIYMKNKKKITKKQYNKYGKTLRKKQEELVLDDVTPWLPSNVIGVAENFDRPDEKTDFYFAQNYDYISRDHISDTDENSSYWSGQEDRTNKNLDEQFKDRTKYNTDNIKRVRDFYDVATDFDRRNSDGVAPLKSIVDNINSCTDLAGLTEILSTPEKNPMAPFFSLQLQQYEYDTSELCMDINFDIKKETFSINPYVENTKKEIEEYREDFDNQAHYILKRLGFDDAATEKLIKGCYSTEDTLAKAIFADNELAGDSKIKPEDIGGLINKHTVFPFGKILNGYGVTSGKAQVELPGYLTALDNYYKEENLEALKAYLIVHNAVSALDSLDLEAFAIANNYIETKDAASITDEQKKDWISEAEHIYESECTDPSVGIMATAVQGAYMENFVDQTAKNRVKGIVAKIKEGLKTVVQNETWLSEEGRKYAVEKLDSMYFFVMSPDELIDTEYLSVDKTKTFYENKFTIEANKLRHNLSYIGKPYDRSKWYYDVIPNLTTTMVNAMYNCSDNSFMIFEGLLGGKECYNNDMTDEELLGKIGNIIGHEMSHGLDPTGSKYDKNGNLVSTPEHPEGWFPAEDYKAFQKKIDKIIEYFKGVCPFPWLEYNGKKLTGEIVGDMGGLAATLEVAKTMPGFDYKKYFASYADLWCDQSGLEYAENTILADSHPIRYLRINLIVSQFDEFYETYGVQEGDGMYISPEDRIRVW